jgi:hypothetical protein
VKKENAPKASPRRNLGRRERTVLLDSAMRAHLVCGNAKAEWEPLNQEKVLELRGPALDPIALIVATMNERTGKLHPMGAAHVTPFCGSKLELGLTLERLHDEGYRVSLVGVRVLGGAYLAPVDEYQEPEPSVAERGPVISQDNTEAIAEAAGELKAARILDAIEEDKHVWCDGSRQIVPSNIMNQRLVFEARADSRELRLCLASGQVVFGELELDALCGTEAEFTLKVRRVHGRGFVVELLGDIVKGSLALASAGHSQPAASSES